MAELTRDDVIEMAQESGLVDRVHLGSEASRELSLRKMQAFAALVAAKVRADEREECAKLCEGRIGGAAQSNEWWGGFMSAMKQCAAGIRARGNS